MRHLFLVFNLIFIFGSVLLTAQSTAPSQRVYKHSLLPQKDTWRSSSDFVNDIIIAKNGMLWISKDNSLVSWDGSRKVAFNNNPYHPYRLQSKKVHKVFETAEEDLVLFSQQEELHIELLPKGAIHSTKISTDQDGKKIKGYLADVILSKDQKIYAAYNEGEKLSIYRLEKMYFSLVHTFSFTQNIQQRPLKIAFHKNAVWVAINGLGVWQSQESSQRQVMQFEKNDQINNSNILFLHSDQRSRLWLGLSDLKKNVFQWDGAYFTPYEIPLLHPVDQLKEDAQGQLLFIAGRYPLPLKSVVGFSKDKWFDYSEFIDSNMLAIYPSLDIKKSFLATTKDNITAIEFRTQKVKNYLHQGIPKEKWGNIVKGIQEDESGDIYFLNEIQGFYKLKTATDEIIEIPVEDRNGKRLKFKCGGAIHRDATGALWFKVCDGESRGILVHYDPVTSLFSFYKHPEIIRDISIQGNHIWIIHHHAKSRHGKLSRFDIETKRFVAMDLNKTLPEPRYCYSNTDSILWVGTLKGLVKINTQQSVATIFTTENSALQSDHIIVIEQGPNQQLLLGTFGEGLQLFDPRQQKAALFNEDNGLINNYVCGILPIDNDRYWLSTFDGLSYFDYSDKTFDDFNTTDGFTHHEFNRYAFYQAKNGVNYLGTVNGANAFRTELLNPVRSDIQVGLAGIKKYFGSRDTLETTRQGLEEITRIDLPPDLTYIELDFYSTDFTESNRQKIFTKLSPYDNDWVYADQQSVRYRFLPPGEYQLEVKGAHSPQVLNMKLISQASFYNTFSFIFPAVVLGVICIAGLIVYQLQRKHHQTQAKQEISRQFARLELKALQAQLNPHFVFNALGAIQYYIQVNDVEAADNYLTRFARLMRKYLDSSKEKVISLKDEIELLTIYTDLEKLRFEDLFEVSIQVEKGMTIEDIFLPSMLIQPFLENAINHGLNQRRDGKGKLSIRFFKKGNVLYCEISDNGIGRKNAQKNKQKGHHSRGMSIINEQVETLRSSGLMDITVDTQDLYPAVADFPGTLILLTIKNLEDDHV